MLEAILDPEKIIASVMYIKPNISRKRAPQ